MAADWERKESADEINIEVRLVRFRDDDNTRNVRHQLREPHIIIVSRASM